MPQDDAAFYAGVLRRIKILIIVLGILGAIVATFWKGWPFGGGFLVGAATSYLSFWRWEHVVESVGPTTKRRSPWLLAFRIGMLLAAGYVIIRLSGVDPGAAIAGLLLPGAAATIEIVYELIFRTHLWNMK